jgi:hypothetical protein
MWTQYVELVFISGNRVMDNVQNCDNYVNIPLSQKYRSYLKQLQVTPWSGFKRKIIIG